MLIAMQSLTIYSILLKRIEKNTNISPCGLRNSRAAFFRPDVFA